MPRRAAAELGHLPPVEDRRVRDRLVIAMYYTIAFLALGVLVSWRAPAAIDLAGKPFAGTGRSLIHATAVQKP